MDATQNSSADADLASVFLSFCAFGARRDGGPASSASISASTSLAAARLDSRGFAKMARDAQQPGGGLGLSPAVVDLVFKAAAAGPGGDGRRVGWAGFLAAVDALAARQVRRVFLFLEHGKKKKTTLPVVFTTFPSINQHP